MRALTLIFLFLVLGFSALAAPPRTAKTVKRDRQQTQKEITDTRKRLDSNSASTKKNLNELENIKAGIARQEKEIDLLNNRLDSLTTAITVTTDSLNACQSTVNGLREELKTTLVKMRDRRKSVNNITFVFSAPNFGSALRRLEYLNRINEWRSHKIGQLKQQVAVLNARKAKLEDMHTRQAGTRSEIDAARRTLDQRRVQQQETVRKLRAEGKELNNLLTAKQKKMKELDRELDRIIAEEQRRREEEQRRAKAAAEEKARKEAAKKNKTEKEPDNTKTAPEKPQKDQATGVADADRRLSGSFAQNRGKLLFPVAGKYTIVGNFGRGAHREISNVEVNNSGIDISVAPGTVVRAVFNGTVSSIFFMPGYNNIVIIRHGAYLTVYAGLTGLTVKKGQQVSTGTTIGKVASDDGEAILHFEVRKERDKLNPLDWVH